MGFCQLDGVISDLQHMIMYAKVYISAQKKLLLILLGTRNIFGIFDDSFLDNVHVNSCHLRLHFRPEVFQAQKYVYISQNIA